MGTSIDPSNRHRARHAIGLAFALCCCGFPLAGAQAPGASPAASITAITLERNCFGCATGSILVLRRDGTATYTVTGTARHGTENRTSRGAVRTEDFGKLARFVMSQGFFDLKELYDDPQIRDGPWTTTTVTRGGEDKQVFRRDDTGPPALRSIEAAIDALRTRIEFVPEAR